MKSVCIKTNNSDNLSYLLSLLENTHQDNVCFSCNKFKLYKNVIVHYTGNSPKVFLSNISELLSYLVIENFEENILKRLIFTNYFYFNDAERETVLEICLELLFESASESLEERKAFLVNSFYDYLLRHKNIVLDGFINFRLKSYTDFLNSIVDTAVNKYIVEREYIEFISLLRIYINSEISSTECVHLIYTNTQSILLDKDKKMINIDKNVFNAKYLSDITFSSNDYALNTLLNILPQKIHVHLVQNSIDEFINTLQLVFEDRLEFCTNCSICNVYKQTTNGDGPALVEN